MTDSTGQDSATRTLSDSDFAVGTEDRYFEDYAAGAVYEYGYVSVTEVEIVAFAERFDPQPIHTDARFAASGPFGGGRGRTALALPRAPGRLTAATDNDPGDTPVPVQARPGPDPHPGRVAQSARPGRSQPRGHELDQAAELLTGQARCR